MRERQKKREKSWIKERKCRRGKADGTIGRQDRFEQPTITTLQSFISYSDVASAVPPFLTSSTRQPPLDIENISPVFCKVTNMEEISPRHLLA